MTPILFFQPDHRAAQIFCRAFLSGRDRADPREQIDTLIACATRAVVAPETIESTGEKP